MIKRPPRMRNRSTNWWHVEFRKNDKVVGGAFVGPFPIDLVAMEKSAPFKPDGAKIGVVAELSPAAMRFLRDEDTMRFMPVEEFNGLMGRFAAIDLEERTKGTTHASIAETLRRWSHDPDVGIGPWLESLADDVEALGELWERRLNKAEEGTRNG